MLTVIIVLLILLFLFVMFGPYWIHATYNRIESDQLASIKVSSIGGLLRIVWRIEPDGQKLDLSLFRIRFWRKDLGNGQSDELVEDESNDTSDDESVDSSSRIPIKFLTRFLENILRILQSFTIKKVNIQGTFGTGDPAITGMLYGFAQPVQSLLGIHWLNWTPDFLERKRNGQIDLVLRFFMASVLFQSSVLAVRSGQSLRRDHASA